MAGKITQSKTMLGCLTSFMEQITAVTGQLTAMCLGGEKDVEMEPKLSLDLPLPYPQSDDEEDEAGDSMSTFDGQPKLK